MGAVGKRGAPEPLSAAGVLLAGAGGVAAGNHHAEKRQRLGEGRQSDYEEEVVQKLSLLCGEPTRWNTKKKVIDVFKNSNMWVSWVKAGHNEQKLINFINRLKIKHLEDGHNKDNGAGVAEFEAEVIEKLNQWCGEVPTWNTKKKVIENFKENPFWAKWTAAGHSEQKLFNLINRLKIRHTEEAAKAAAAGAGALAAANGTAPPVVTESRTMSLEHSQVCTILSSVYDSPPVYHKCPACSKKFRTQKAMSDHCADKGDAAHEAYRTPAGLNFRVAAMTTSHGDAATTCPACSKKFPDKRTMKHHCANKGDAVHEVYRYHEGYRKRKGLNLAVRPKGTGPSDDRPARPPTGRIPIGLLPFQRLPSGDSFSDNFSDSDRGGMYFDEGMYGFSAHDCDELLCQGVKPWDDDAGAVLGALHGW